MFSLRGLYNLGGQVLEPVPETARSQFTYWRGVHVGKIALNFADGLRIINTSVASHGVHFTDDYDFARDVATTLLADNGVGGTQFSPDDARRLARLSCMIGDQPLPTMVVGLDYRFNYSTCLVPSEAALGIGLVFKGLLTISMIDPWSRDAILNLLEPGTQ